MPKSKQCKSREFSPKVRKIITERDNDTCIFCQIGYHMEKATYLGLQLRSVMHYILQSELQQSQKLMANLRTKSKESKVSNSAKVELMQWR